MAPIEISWHLPYGWGISRKTSARMRRCSYPQWRRDFRWVYRIVTNLKFWGIKIATALYQKYKYKNPITHAYYISKERETSIWLTLLCQGIWYFIYFLLLVGNLKLRTALNRTSAISFPHFFKSSFFFPWCK